MGAASRIASRGSATVNRDIDQIVREFDEVCALLNAGHIYDGLRPSEALRRIRARLHAAEFPAANPKTEELLRRFDYWSKLGDQKILRDVVENALLVQQQVIEMRERELADVRARLRNFLVASVDASGDVGLRAQGHLPTVERMLATGATWDEIGAAIGWDGSTAQAWYAAEKEM